MLMKVQGCRKGKKRVFSLQSFVPVIKLQVLSYSLSHSPSCSPLSTNPDAAALALQTTTAASFAADAPLDAETRGRSRKLRAARREEQDSFQFASSPNLPQNGPSLRLLRPLLDNLRASSVDPAPRCQVLRTQISFCSLCPESDK